MATLEHILFGADDAPSARVVALDKPGFTVLITTSEPTTFHDVIHPYEIRIQTPGAEVQFGRLSRVDIETLLERGLYLGSTTQESALLTLVQVVPGETGWQVIEHTRDQ